MPHLLDKQHDTPDNHDNDGDDFREQDPFSCIFLCDIWKAFSC